MNGDWFANAALLGWPIVSFFLYRTKAIGFATVWTILGGFLLLPSVAAIKIEMIPAFDKSTVPNVCALVGCLILAPRKKHVEYKARLTSILIFIYLVSPIATSAFNNDPIVLGDRVLPGVGNYDAISAVLSQSLFFIPFFVGRRVLASAADTETILKALAVAGLLYSIPMLFEIRMSPQLSIWVYGVYPDFSTEGRYGGFRPVVFMNNGLVLAFFIMTSFLASVAMWRTKVRINNFPSFGVSAYLAVIIILCKSAGSLVFGIVGGFLTARTSTRQQTKIAVLLVSIGLTYPLLRSTDIFPTKLLLSIAETISEERAQSLEFRFNQEDQLLTHASQRFLLGWGRYGRGRVYDDDTGRDLSVTDGLWIITLSTFGIIGFLAQFSLLAIPVYRAASTIKFAKSRENEIFLATMALILALAVVEQLPNSSISPWSWLLAGALLGRAENLHLEASNLGNHQVGVSTVPGRSKVEA
jgi:hypothetical protein